MTQLPLRKLNGGLRCMSHRTGRDTPEAPEELKPGASGLAAESEEVRETASPSSKKEAGDGDARASARKQNEFMNIATGDNCKGDRGLIQIATCTIDTEQPVRVINQAHGATAVVQIAGVLDKEALQQILKSIRPKFRKGNGTYSV